MGERSPCGAQAFLIRAATAYRYSPGRLETDRRWRRLPGESGSGEEDENYGEYERTPRAAPSAGSRNFASLVLD